ncbi:MAG: hypothetical protein J1F43_02945 [Muribaculaceae bacterium]|nr:hypothetical protein [Muribaculaceae bacterium]
MEIWKLINYKYIHISLLILISSLFLSACHELDANDYYPDREDESMELCLSLDPGNAIFSRAVNTTDPLHDSFINHREGDFRILIYTSDQNLLTVLTDRELNFNESNVSGWYTIDARIIQDSPELYIVALLNWNSIGSISHYPAFNDSPISDFPYHTLESLWATNKEFSLDSNQGESWYPSIEDKRLVPMFGVSRINIAENVTLNQGKRIINVTIPVVRSLAKISFEVSDELYARGFDMNYCSISNYNSSGFFNPDMSLSGNSMDGKGNLTITKASSPNQTPVSGALMFTNMNGQPGKKKLVAYLPEMDNSGLTTNNEERPMLNVSLTYENEKFAGDKIIELSNYSEEGLIPDNSPLFDVVRNNYYAYTITDIDENQNIKLKYTVCPWTRLETEIEFN